VDESTFREVRVVDHEVTRESGIETSYQDVIIAQAMVSRPDLVRRPKPADLWLARTSRLVKSTRYAALSPLIREQTFSNPDVVDRAFLWPTIPPDVLLHRGGLTSSLNNQLLGKIKSQNVNLAVSVKELGQTTDMVTGLAYSVLGAFQGLRSGRTFSDFVRRLRDPKTRSSRAIARKWLEYNYGWAPLMQDIYGLSLAMQTRLQKGLPLYARVQKTTTENGTTSFGTTAIGTYQSSVMEKAVARWFVDSTSLKTLSSLGITNPAMVVWESVPYSFVIDWIIDISSCLNSFDALVGITDLTVGRSFGSDTIWDIRTINTNSGWVQIQPGASIAITKSRYRGALERSLSPAMPTYSPSLSIQKAANAVALLRNLK